MAQRAGESEFGGVEGLIQPPPHDPTSSELLGLAVSTRPEDPTDTPERVLLERRGKAPRGLSS